MQQEKPSTNDDTLRNFFLCTKIYVHIKKRKGNIKFLVYSTFE